MRQIYLDYAATTPTDPEVIKAMLPYFSEIYGNPLSLHGIGQGAKRAIEEVRERIASFIGAQAEEIVFTSGGTESNNTAVKGVAFAMRERGNHIIASRIEHHAVLESCHFLGQHGFEVSYVDVNGEGLVDPVSVEQAITERTILVTIMHANNEIGTVQPIEEIGRIARRKGIVFHTDAVQTFGSLPVRVSDLNVDLLSGSAHKFYGPKGAGFLYVRKGVRLKPLLHGGEQERSRRGSTHNVPGIMGMGKAIELAERFMETENTRLTSLRDRMIQRITTEITHAHLNGHSVRRLPNNVNISFEYCNGESLLLSLDMEGVACSTGSACNSASLEPSHVLMALGLPQEIAYGSLRFSLGKYTREEDIEHVMKILPATVKRLRAMSPRYRKGESQAGGTAADHRSGRQE